MPQVPYEGATAEQIGHPLVREFLAIHDMFRNELAAMLHFANELISGDRKLTDTETKIRTQALIRTGMRYTQLLHFHHHGESSMMFPGLHEEGLETAVIQRLESDHDEIAVLIDKFDDAIRNFAAIDPNVITNDLRRLSDALQSHLAYEETHVCPLLTRWTHWPMHS